jgi:hypothetical protein
MLIFSILVNPAAVLFQERGQGEVCEIQFAGALFESMLISRLEVIEMNKA